MLLGWQVYKSGEEVRRGTDLEEALEARTEGDFIWFRVGTPQPSDITALRDAFDLPELAVEDAMHAHQRPKLERYGDATFFVLKPAQYDDATESISLGEIHVFAGHDHAITIRHADIGPLDDVCRRLSLDPELTARGPMAVLYAVADQVVDAYIPITRALERDIDEIERQVFDVEQQPPTERIYGLIREVLDFQRATASLLLPLDDLAKGRNGGVGDGLAELFRDVADHARQVHDRTDAFRELLGGALDANIALIGMQENADQRKMAAWAAVALVPTILGGVWGMNVPVPLQDTWYGFAVVVGIMVAASGGLWWRLHQNDWL